MVLADTNVLLRLANAGDTDYALVRSAVDKVKGRGEDLCFSLQNLVEFWNVCTRPVAKNGLGLTIAETDTRARVFEDTFVFVPDTEAVRSEWRRLAVDYSVRGVQVHDARIVGVMLAHGIEHLLTLNDRDFKRYREISVLHPRDLAPAA